MEIETLEGVWGGRYNGGGLEIGGRCPLRSMSQPGSHFVRLFDFLNVERDQQFPRSHFPRSGYATTGRGWTLEIGDTELAVL